MRIVWLTVVLFFMFVFGISYLFNEVYNTWWKVPSVILCIVGILASFMSFIYYIDYPHKKIKIKR
jgi:purine-cytosine permease-like protein